MVKPALIRDVSGFLAAWTLVLVAALPGLACPASRPVASPESPGGQREPPRERSAEDPERLAARLAFTRDGEVGAALIHELRRRYLDLAERVDGGSGQRASLERFRARVNPAIRAALRQAIAEGAAATLPLLQTLILFEDDSPETAALLLRMLASHSRRALTVQGDDQAVTFLVGYAVQAIGARASRGKGTAAALSGLRSLLEAILSPGGVATLDPLSFIRTQIIKAIEPCVRHRAFRKAGASILARIVTEGIRASTTQDPSVTLLAIIGLGESGDSSSGTAEVLVEALYGKGRGRRLFSFAATALAQLSTGPGGAHPALPALLALIDEDPWARQISRRAPRHAALRAQVEQRSQMPACPLPGLAHVCRSFWQAHVERWDQTEPGVVPMNALLVLGELGDPSVAPPMLARWGIDALRQRWLAQLPTPRGPGAREVELRGVMRQRTAIKSYAEDVYLRAEMLRILGRMGATREPRVRSELLRSLTWSGDPVLLHAAGEGISLAPYDEALLEALIAQITRADSFMMAAQQRQPGAVAGSWRLRERFLWFAALLATPIHADLLLALTARDLMTPTALRREDLPRRGSPFHDGDDERHLGASSTDAVQRRQAETVLASELCRTRELLWVGKECGTDLDRYLEVAAGARRVPAEDCETPGPPPGTARAVPRRREAPGWRARLKALRMVEVLGSRLPPGSPQVRRAIQVAVAAYRDALRYRVHEAVALRQMALLVIDRLGHPAAQRGVTCAAGDLLAARSPARRDLDLALHRLHVARSVQDASSAHRYQRLIDRLRAAPAAAAPDRSPVSCFRWLGMIVEDETRRREDGVWQINRDARGVLGRLARWAGVHHGDL